jgi:hypothetical protein
MMNFSLRRLVDSLLRVFLERRRRRTLDQFLRHPPETQHQTSFHQDVKFHPYHLKQTTILERNTLTTLNENYQASSRSSCENQARRKYPLYQPKVSLIFPYVPNQYVVLLKAREIRKRFVEGEQELVRIPGSTVQVSVQKILSNPSRFQSACAEIRKWVLKYQYRRSRKIYLIESHFSGERKVHWSAIDIIHADRA